MSSINKDGTFLTHFTPHRYKIWHFDKRIKDDGDGARQRTTKTKSKLKSEKKRWCKAVKGRKETMGKREERPKQKGV